MAGFRDWMSLAKSTVRSFRLDEVRQLYGIEWPEAKGRLIADHADAIAKQKGRLRRWMRTASALIYGLAHRLAPQRRIVFLIAGLSALSAFLFFADQENVFAGLLGFSLLALTLLLALELIDKTKFRDELELARDLQSGLIPKDLPRFADFEIEAFNEIANMVGGDIYDFIPLEDGRMAVLFGDASGHGMAAGLVMAVAHASFRTQIDVDPSPEAVFGTMNRILCRTGGSRSFFAGTYFLIEPSGSYSAVFAGHPPVLLLGANGRVRLRLGEGAYPLGIKHSSGWVVETGQIEPGETLLFYSDGLVEARDSAGNDFGYDRLALLAELNGQGTPRQFLYSLIAVFRSFTLRKSPEDDVSIAVLRRKAEVSAPTAAE